MHYPIDFVGYQNCHRNKETLRSVIRILYSIHENEIVLCVVGKLVEWKNQDHIIEAMKLLENEGIYIKLLLEIV